MKIFFDSNQTILFLFTRSCALKVAVSTKIEPELFQRNHVKNVTLKRTMRISIMPQLTVNIAAQMNLFQLNLTLQNHSQYFISIYILLKSILMSFVLSWLCLNSNLIYFVSLSKKSKPVLTLKLILILMDINPQWELQRILLKVEF